MVAYPLDHLTQEDHQNVSGPVQDDEALLLFAAIRCMRLRNVVELGGLSGYSARNFCEAVGPSGRVYSLDLKNMPKVAENHFPIVGDATLLGRDELKVDCFDLVFFDCHEYEVSMAFLARLRAEELIDDNTVLAFHDTNTHPYKSVHWAYKVPGGWVHQDAERRMVNELKEAGYEAFCFHSRAERHDNSMPLRHGITLMTRFTPLKIAPTLLRPVF